MKVGHTMAQEELDALMKSITGPDAQRELDELLAELMPAPGEIDALIAEVTPGAGEIEKLLASLMAGSALDDNSEVI